MPQEENKFVVADRVKANNLYNKSLVKKDMRRLAPLNCNMNGANYV